MDQQFAYLIIYLSIIVFLVIQAITITRRNKKKLPPGPTGFPIIGNLIAIGNRPHESLAKLAKTYGPLMTVRMGFKTTIVASSPQMAKQILQNNDLACLGRLVPDAVTAGTSSSIFVAWISGDDPKWKRFRKLYKTQVFTTQRLDALQGLRHQTVDEMVKHVAKASESEEEVNIGSLVFSTSLSLLSNSMLSGALVMDTSVSDDPVQQLQVSIGKIMELAAKPNLSDFFPFLKPFDLQGIKRTIKVSYDRLGMLVEGAIKQRLGHRALGLTRYGDFLDVLLDHSEEYGPQELNPTDIKGLITDLFIGGTDTTKTTMEWAMAELLKNPRIMAKAKQHLIEVIGSNNRRIQEDDIPKLGYLQCILKESMRLHPTAPLLLPHKTLTAIEIHGYAIPQNTELFVNSWALSRDPEFWDKPTEFIPERFMTEMLQEIDFLGTNFHYTPFGSERRICPGMSLAMRMTSLMLASLIHHFEWKLAGGLTPETIDMTDQFGVTLQKAIPLVAIPLLPK